MHDTAYEHGRLFFELYWRPEFLTVVDLGAQDVNGSLRDHCPPGANYIGLDMAPGRGVDMVVQPGMRLPLADESADVVVTSSAFEHDAVYWLTFLELLRILRPGGLLYVNAPSNGTFHRYPVDCWRFYPDAGLALVQWAARSGVQVEIAESFVARAGRDGWADFVGVFRKPSAHGLVRAGRIADRTAAANIHDGLGGAPEAIERERETTFEAEAAAKAAEGLEQAGRRIAELERGLAEARAALSRRDQTLARLEASLLAGERREAELRAEVARSLAAEQGLRASTSWRLTAPLRAAIRLVRR